MAEAPLHVVVAGAGVAGVEALLALDHLARDRVALTLLADGEEWVLPPMAVAEPFGAGRAGRYALDDLTHATGAHRVRGLLTTVDPDAHMARTDRGEDLRYDAILVALGAETKPSIARATTFDPHATELVGGLLRDIEDGYVRRIAIVVPTGAHWPLPAYELAYLTARDARGMGQDVEITVVTPEDAPLDVFGPRAAEAVTHDLASVGVRVECSVHAAVGPGRPTSVELRPGGRVLEVDRVLAPPTLVPRVVPGLPTDAHGFVPIDDHGRVQGFRDVYAAGDATNFPVKLGGVAAEQADAIAADIAHRAGAAVEPRPFRRLLRAHVLGSGGGQWMRRDLSQPNEAIAGFPMWWPPGKVAGRYLAPYVEGLERARAGRTTTRAHH